jgi:2-methylcitrate dehydratase PrpD
MQSESRFGDAAQAVAAHVVNMRSGPISPATATAVKQFTYDTLGVGVGGAGSLYGAKVARAAQRWSAPSGRAAPIWGIGAAAAPGEAAFVNAFFAHCQEFDCVHEAAVLHPFTVVIPALLAAAAEQPFDGRAFIAAAAAGVDVAAGLGIAATSQIKFFRPATCGLFGATAAVACARGLDAETTVNAFGFALALASGTMQAHVEGTPALAVSVGAAARSALQAVDLAMAGLPGPCGSIDGPFGYLALFETTSDVERLLGPLGAVSRPAEVSWKPYPTGRAAHGGIEMTLDLRARGLTAETLQELIIRAPPLISHLVGRPVRRPLEVNYARLCLPYCAAAALLEGGVGLDAFAPQRLAEERVLALGARIRVETVDHPDPAAFVPQRAEALLKDGSRLEAQIDVLPGTVHRPLTPAQQAAKFAACWRFGCGRPPGASAERLAALLETLEDVADVAALGWLAADLKEPPA